MYSTFSLSQEKKKKEKTKSEEKKLEGENQKYQ